MLRAEHIISGTLLHDGHPVRCALAGACVADFLQNYPHKFADTAEEYPEFAVDLLHEVRLTLASLKSSRRFSQAALLPSGGEVWDNNY